VVAIDLEEFHTTLFQDVLALADSQGAWTEDAFFEEFCTHLIDAGEFETADRTSYMPVKGGIRVDGYGGDPLTSDGVLNLIVSDFSQSPDITSITGTEMEAAFKRLTAFVTKSLDAKFRNNLEESSPAFGLADLIATRWAGTAKIRMFLITDKVLSSRVDGKASGTVEGVPVTYSVWDMTRLHRFAASGGDREEIAIDLEGDFGVTLPVLPAHLDDAGYEAYLVVVPGAVLAAIYDRWHARLLEQNVRVFLQARGGVNKGIKNTIENDPQMFFAYNNGITATTEKVIIRNDQQGLRLVGLQNFQIVNGGQTTASIHAASRTKGTDLSRVFVQMKLSVVPRESAATVVSCISLFANSQNKVNAADFFANHPFHVKMEQFSRRLYAPSPDGTFRETKWYYERARGQYQDARALLTVAQRKKFELEYPKEQVISKTEFAKYFNPWLGLPDSVSKGSQKNFAEFAGWVGPEWLKHQDEFNETFYKHSIAKAIVFKATEILVTEQPWYEGGGIRSRVVPYAIAKLAHDASLKHRYVDFDQIWKSQAISSMVRTALVIASERVHTIIMGDPLPVPNPLEWAKQQACWNRIKNLEVTWPKGWFESLLSENDQKDEKKTGVKAQRMLNGIEAQVLVANAGGAFWKAALVWAKEHEALSLTESGILAAAASLESRLPSEKQCFRTVEILKKLHEEGYQEGLQLLA
jgi:hypothetical protein